MMLYISQQYGTRQNAISLIKAARDRNISVTTLTNCWTPPNPSSKKEPYALYGEHAFCEFAAQELAINLHSNSPDWISRVPNEFLKRGVAYKTLGELLLQQAANDSVLDKAYLEPSDEACFQPGVYTSNFPRVPQNTSIIVQSNVTWTVKYRFVIVNGKIETFCCYRVINVFNTPTIHGAKYSAKGVTAEAFVKMVMSHTHLAPSVVLDVGYIQDVGWAIVGTYPVWSSDVYGCDPDKFLKAIFVACEPIHA